MTVTIRILFGAGLFLLGYYLGREVGRFESRRDEFLRMRGEERPGRTFDADDLGLREQRART